MARKRTRLKPWIVRGSPDGRLLVVVNRGDSSATLLDAESLEELAVIEVAKHPEMAVALPDASKVFLATESKQVSVVDLKTKKLLANLPLTGKASDLVLKPDGGELYVPVPESHGVTIINTTTNEIAEHIVLGNAPVRGAISQNGQTLFVADAGGNQILSMQTKFRQLTRPIPSGQSPAALRLTPGEEMLLAVNADTNDMAVIRIRDRSLLTLIPVGRRPRDIAILVFSAEHKIAGTSFHRPGKG
jgi:YVTN family beta-propeller protein